MDVLKSNRIYGNSRTEMIKLYDTYHEYTINKRVSNVTLKQLCYFEHIQNSVFKDEEYVERFSVFFGRKVILSKQQVIWHIKDTIRLLEENKNFSLGLLRENNPYFVNNTSYLCRKNQYFITCKNFFKFTREIEITNPVVFMMEKEWEKNIPFDYKNNQMVAEKLKSLIYDLE